MDDILLLWATTLASGARSGGHLGDDGAVVGISQSQYIRRTKRPSTRTCCPTYLFLDYELDVVITLLLIFLVVDATLFSRSVVIHLTAVESHWPGKLVESYKGRFHLGRANLEDWLDMRFVADRTRCITRLIYFPFLMLALLMVSRSPIFDIYNFTPTRVIAGVIMLTIIVGSVVSLRHVAEQARNTAIEHLSEKIMAAKRTNPNMGSQLEMLRTELRDMQDGAFAPPLSQPIVKAVLLPLVSYGGTWLVQLYALPGL